MYILYINNYMGNLNKKDINYIINILKNNDEKETLLLKNNPIYINIMK